MRRNIGPIVLLGLISVLGALAQSRGVGPGIGPEPATLRGPYATEEAWVVNEIVRDVTEMSAHPNRATMPVVTAIGHDGLYRVGRFGRTVELDLRDDVWSPGRFAVYARAALGRVSPAMGTRTAQPVYRSLLEFTAASIVRASDATARSLTADMRDARAHEAAALTLGAFALRESAGRFSDTRWTLNRMTAHLAMANALTQSPGPDGRLAHAVLLTLSNRPARALEALDRIGLDARSNEIGAWIRALRLRITQDWRALRTPERATPLEEKEYFRTRRATASPAPAQEELKRLNADPAVDWLRLVENSSVDVDDGWLMAGALELERAEYVGVYRSIYGREMAGDPSGDLNARATRCIGADGPRVIPWGAWAEFAQRHLAMFIDRNDRFHRHTLDSASQADDQKRKMQAEFGKLTMFPLAAICWTKGPRGDDPDLTYVNQAIGVAILSPERVTPAIWSLLQLGSRQEPVARSLPLPATWFMRSSIRRATA